MGELGYPFGTMSQYSDTQIRDRDNVIQLCVIQLNYREVHTHKNYEVARAW